MKKEFMSKLVEINGDIVWSTVEMPRSCERCGMVEDVIIVLVNTHLGLLCECCADDMGVSI